MSELPVRDAGRGGVAGEERFLMHLARSGDLVGARRLEEAEVEVLRGLAVIPRELRALNLLALIRFKLGRLAEAREVYREIVSIAPRDAGAWLNLGLTALKMGQFDEAVAELEKAGSIRPDELRAWSYLGVAYARQGQTALAAAAFRRAGQHDLAAEIDRTEERGRGADADTSSPPPPAPVVGQDPGSAAAPDRGPQDVAESVGNAETGGLPAGPAGPPGAARARAEAEGAAESEPAGAIMSASSFALLRLLPAEPGCATLAPSRAGMIRLQVKDEAFVRGDAVAAYVGTLGWETAHRRTRGQLEPDALGAEDRPMYRLRGAGNVWLSLDRRRLVALLLEDDILYVREDRVVAFDGDVYWEAGRLPCASLRLVQFRGRGRVALEVEGEPAGLKLEPQVPVTVSLARMLGWVGRVLPHGVGSTRPGAGVEVSCEGEGVVLIEGPERRS